ncbi:unnamed protein product [Medioppia subpectinata]|uniref:Uncharacterized protein n=1 Tax=Medioppia subpectinata TaxID=1979941 RepID=A0A7R9KYL0_9ACAR|nr:unnamed protein product [Medioppia subpectinata]CAG2111920.1 unnamed protein product [Medioppia subpectinata]
MKKFFGFARRKSSSSLKGLNPRRFSIGSSASSTLQIQVVRGGYNVDLGKVDQSFTKLHKAALLNDEEKVRKYIKSIDVNARDSSDRTPLHLATVNGNLKIIRTLIEAGAHVNAQDNDGKAPIVKAIECNHEDLVQFFVCVGADTEVADYETGNTPLHWALSMGAVKAAQYLLRNAKQLDVNKRNNQNETCLHLAVKLPQNCVILEDLIANGTHLDARDDRQKTALMIATANENLQAVNTLLKYGSNTYSSDEDMRHSISVNRNNMKNNMRTFQSHETDSADSWPDTEDEDSNYERPMSKESNKARKESFKSNSFRVSSLVDETIVEELKTDDNNDNDDYVICKPSTSREENVGDITETSKDIKLIWNQSSSSSDDEDVNNKVSESGTLGKIDTLKQREEVLVKNAINEKQNQQFLDSDPFNVDVMDELEMLLIQETHDGNVDFITQMKTLLDEDPPPPQTTPNRVQSPPTQPLQSTPLKIPVNMKPQNTDNVKKNSERHEVFSDKNDTKQSPTKQSATNGSHNIPVHKLRRGSNVDIKDNVKEKKIILEEVRRRSVELKTKTDESSAAAMEDHRRRSYAEVVAQKGGKQAFMDELKSSISARAKSYADVVSTSSNSEFESIKETKIPILRVNSHLSPLKQSLRQTVNQSNGSPKHNQNNGFARQTPIETNSYITSNNSNTNINSNTNMNKSLSKIPLPMRQSSVEQIRSSHTSESTTSEDSIVMEDDVRVDSSPTKTSLNESAMKSNGKAKSGAIRSSKLRRRVNELNEELKRGLTEKSLLSSENESIRKQLLELNERIQRESSRNYELEKKLIKLESELNQYRVECDMKCKENNAIKSELQLIVDNFDDNQKQCRYLEDENQKMKSQIKSMKYEEEVLRQKLTQQTLSAPIGVCNHEDLVIGWKSKVDGLHFENDRLKEETEELQRISIEKRLEYERELFEWQKRNLDIESDLKRLQLEMQVNSIKPTPEEQIELLKAVRDLNQLMAKLDDRITRNEESQQLSKARNFNEEMFECARNLLDQMREELSNFKDMLKNTANRENNSETDEKQLTAFESRIAELRSSLERLEDQIQSQELQLFRQSDIISFATPLRKSSSSRELFISTSNKPKSWFVQTLFRLQSHIQSTTPNGDSITAFVHQKTRLQKQIHELKSELGIFAESVH